MLLLINSCSGRFVVEGYDICCVREPAGRRAANSGYIYKPKIKKKEIKRARNVINTNVFKAALHTLCEPIYSVDW